MTVPDLEAVRRAVGAVTDPELRRPLGELDMIGDVSLDGTVATIPLRLTVAGCPAADRIEADVAAAALAAGATEVDVEVSVMSPQQREQLVTRLRGERPRQLGPGALTRVIAVASGKGGVGKSSVTVNLAMALAARGLRIGIVDLDVHGFSIPGLLGLAGSSPTRVGELVMPPRAFDVPAISIGMFLDAAGRAPAAVSWRGPLLHRTVTQFFSDVWFGDLDVMLVDMPPGTGDIAITFGQLIPQAEVLVVTTPQAAAAEVAQRAAVVARQTGQRVIGVVENMAGFTAADGSVVPIFGAGGGASAAAALSTTDERVALVGSIPISVGLREGGDAGTPVRISDPEDPASRAFDAIATAVLAAGEGRAGHSLLA